MKVINLGNGDVAIGAGRYTHWDGETTAFISFQPTKKQKIGSVVKNHKGVLTPETTIIPLGSIASAAVLLEALHRAIKLMENK